MIFKTINFDQVKEFKDLKNKLRGSLDAVGFASLYLWRCNEESKFNDEISVHVYNNLINIDSRLGTTATEQLFFCVFYSLRYDLIEVRISSGVV